MESKKKLNILILSWRGPKHPNAGGAEISTHEHVKAWVKAGHSVTLFTSYYQGAKKEELVDGVKIIRSGQQDLGVHIEVFKWYCFKKHSKFDLVIDQFHGIPFFTPIFVRVKKLAFIHEVAKEVWKLNQWPNPLNFMVAILGGLIEPLIFKLYKKVPFMTVSESTKNDLVLWGIPKQNINIIHNGITIPNISSKKAEKKTVVYLGALAKDKGIETALVSFNYLQKRFKEDIQFWIIGRGEEKYLRFLKSQAVSLGLENTKFWGYVDEIKKFELLGSGHVLINPSIREGWGLVVIEAAAMGTPTIAFNVPGLRDSIINGKTGILVNELSPGVQAEKIAELLDDKMRLSQISKKAISWSKNFSWEKSTAASLRLIEEISS